MDGGIAQLVGTAIWPVLLYHVISYAAVYFVMALTGLAQPDAALSALMAAVLALPVLIGMRVKDRAAGERKGAPYEGHGGVWLYILAPVLGCLLSALSAWLMQKAGLDRYFSNASQEALLASSMPVKCLGLGLLVPAAEELAYRGLFYPRLGRVLGRRAAIVVSALCFGLGHGNVIQFLYAFPMGILLCLLYDYADCRIAIPLLVHMGANLFSVFAGVYGPS